MSTPSIGATPVPPLANFTLPTGLSGGSAGAPVGAATASSSHPGAPKISTYQTAYSNLVIQDNIELIQVSAASPAAAQANVANVLAQATALQSAQLAKEQQAAASASAAAPVIAKDALDVPTLESVIGQSDKTANTALQQHLAAPPGSIFNSLA